MRIIPEHCLRRGAPGGPVGLARALGLFRPAPAFLRSEAPSHPFQPPLESWKVPPGAGPRGHIIPGRPPSHVWAAGPQRLPRAVGARRWGGPWRGGPPSGL